MIRLHDVWNRGTRKHLAIALLLGLALRLFFAIRLPAQDVDYEVYSKLGQEMVLTHSYAYDSGAGLAPTDVRVPGYPLFLSALYVMFGDSARAVFIAQALLDLCACLLVAVLAASLAPESSRKRVVISAAWLAALCPFVANYAAVGLSEVLATFFTTAALIFLVWAYQREFASAEVAREGSVQRGVTPGLLWFLGGLIVGLASLVRPETPIMLAAPAVVLAARWYKPVNWLRLLRTGLLLGIGMLIPLLPWAARNWITLHKVQFLTDRYFQMPGSYVPIGFYDWTHTWLVSYNDVDAVMNRLENEPLNMSDFPASAFDSPDERARLETLVEDQRKNEFMISPQDDVQFAQLARERTAHHPLRTYVTVPFQRSLTLWFTPRTELLPHGGEWWPPLEQWRSGHLDFTIAFLFAMLNFFYAGLALAGVYVMRHQKGIALIAVFIVARTLFIAVSHYTVEPRFVLECVPAVLALAALLWARRQVSPAGF
jgi:4-amino-4-deoxy-L-arabinose transferase-like glycosyltransferase